MSTGGTFLYWRKTRATVYASHGSPDGRFMIQVVEYPRLSGHLPGDVGGGSGYVQLVDTRTGRMLERKKAEMVLTIDTVRWTPRSVEVKLFAEWPLPE